jgi:hypothetical protein
MPYPTKPLSCDPARIKGMSERLIISRYENNYGGVVIAINSMILHELFFDGWVGPSRIFGYSTN